MAAPFPKCFFFEKTDLVRISVAILRFRCRLSRRLLLRLRRRYLLPFGDETSVIFAAEMRFDLRTVGEAQLAEEAEVGVILDADLRLGPTVGRAQTPVDGEKFR